jgi:hypothetical protein
MRLLPTAQPSLKFGGVLPAELVENGVVLLVKLVFGQTGVCTPATLSPGRAIARRQKRGVRHHTLACTFIAGKI